MTGVFKYLVVSCFLAGAMLNADTITLTENLGDGKTFSDTKDTISQWSGSSEYNFGGGDLMEVGCAIYASDSFYRVTLLRFDLSIVEEIEVSAVNSAVLRFYQTDGGSAPKVVHQLLEDWEEGTGNGADYTTVMDGLNCYARNDGTEVLPIDLTEISHLGQTLYYFDGASGLATNPVNGIGHYISRGQTATTFRNWDVPGYRLQDAGDLDTLALSPPKANQSYYYDKDAERVYVNFNSYLIHWWKTGDLWADSIWDGSTQKGPISGSLKPTEYFDRTDPNPDRGWYEIDVTGAVSNWLMSGQGNYGFRLANFGNYPGTDSFATSENEDGLRPELVIDFEPPPPAGLTIMGE